MTKGVIFLIFNPPLCPESWCLAAGKEWSFVWLNEPNWNCLKWSNMPSLVMLCQKLWSKNFWMASNVQYLQSVMVSHISCYPLLKTTKNWRGDTGPNTGGMGSVSPVFICRSSFHDKVEARIVSAKLLTVWSVKALNIKDLFSSDDKSRRRTVCHWIQCTHGRPGNRICFPTNQERHSWIFDAMANQTLHQIELDIDRRFVVSVMLVSKDTLTHTRKEFLST